MGFPFPFSEARLAAVSLRIASVRGGFATSRRRNKVYVFSNNRIGNGTGNYIRERKKVGRPAGERIYGRWKAAQRCHFAENKKVAADKAGLTVSSRDFKREDSAETPPNPTSALGFYFTVL